MIEREIKRWGVEGKRERKRDDESDCVTWLLHRTAVLEVGGLVTLSKVSM